MFPIENPFSLNRNKNMHINDERVTEVDCMAMMAKTNPLHFA